MIQKKHFLIKPEIDSINVRKNNDNHIFYYVDGNKIGDKIDDLTHPNETKKERIIRKTKNYVNEVKEDVNEAYGNIKDKYFNKS